MEEPSRRMHKKKKKKRTRKDSSSSDDSSSSSSNSSSPLAKKRSKEKKRGQEREHHKSNSLEKKTDCSNKPRREEEKSREKRKEHSSNHDRHREGRHESRRRDNSPGGARLRDLSPPRQRNGSAERSRHREGSVEHQRPPREDRGREQSRHHRSDQGSRWDTNEESQGRRIKQEINSDHEQGGGRGGGRGSGGFRQRGGSFRGRGRGRGRGGGGGGDDGNHQWGKPQDGEESKPKYTGPKEEPNFGLSGKLTEETNTINGIVIKYSEPVEARVPKRRWRLYVFKGQEAMPTLYIHRQSAYLMGRDRKIADIPLDHPSISKQHAALQYRLVACKREDGITKGRSIRPYIIDLESANGTYVNNKKIEPRKYVQLMEKDVVKFGYSSREYVLLHEHSQDTHSEDDDDIPDAPEEAVQGTA